MNQSEDKRMIKSYEVLQAIHIGDKEVLFCEDKALDNRYLCCFYEQNEIFLSAYEGFCSNDYLAVMELFCDRVKAQIEQVKGLQVSEMGVITSEMCFTDDNRTSIEGKVIAIQPNSLRREYQSADHQIFLVTGGFGSAANSRGSAVFCTNLYTGKQTRWERHDVLGEVKREFLPGWAKNKLAALQKQQVEKIATNSKLGKSNNKEVER